MAENSETKQSLPPSNLVPKAKTSYPVPPFDELTMILFGKPNAGETWFATGCPNSLVLATEPGQEFTKASVLKLYQHADPWATLKNMLAEMKEMRGEIKEGKRPLADCPYTSFTVDIVDNLSDCCRDHVCAQDGLKYPPKQDYGATWAKVTREWKKVIGALHSFGNVRFLTHCNVETVEVPAEGGLYEEVDKRIPTFSGGKSAQFLDGIVNATGFIGVDKTGKHVITFNETATIGAKDRTDILCKLGVMPSSWVEVEKSYNNKAKELGFEIKSIRKEPKK